MRQIKTLFAALGFLAVIGLSVSSMTEAAPAPRPAVTPALAGTDPAANETVKAPLPMIHMLFNGKIDPKLSGFEVTTADGKKVEVGEAMPMGDTMLMAMPKTPLPAGTYKVKWHAAGTDAKTVQGEFAFTVQ